MRPHILNPLFAPITSLKNIGEQQSKLINKLLKQKDPSTPARIIDLLFIKPYAIIDRTLKNYTDALPINTIVTIKVAIVKHLPPPSQFSKRPYKIIAKYGDETINILYFVKQSSWVKHLLPIAQKVIISGKLELFKHELTIVHPDYVVNLDQANNLPPLEPIYPLTAGLTNKSMIKIISQAVQQIPKNLPEWLPAEIIESQNLPSFSAALHRLHRPRHLEDINPQALHRRRLALDETLAYQLTLALNKKQQINHSSIRVNTQRNLIKKLSNIIPYQLTNSQSLAIKEILADMQKPTRMYRLLQGDVGSGKTIVSFYAMLKAIELGGQAALMAPTEVLAQQHLANLADFCQQLDIKAALLTSRDKGKKRDLLLADLHAGKIDILIGTHALIQPDVKFKQLNIAVIDEQHRFGVNQRLQLANKNCDLLFMSATPIPRSLVLTAYGDMDVSKITEKPIGRLPIKTVAIAQSRINEVVNRLHHIIQQDQQVYWVCPLIEENETISIASLEERFSYLKGYFKEQVGCLHGKMSNAEKDRILNEFNQGKIKLLVSTSIIEVGMDVKQATVIIIENAERFGLAQLHQLRGRVGRNQLTSSCLLLHSDALSPIAQQRLAIIRATEDGFTIAEEDLKLRGEGELLGDKQSGIANFYFLEPRAQLDLIEKAYKLSAQLVKDSIKLSTNMLYPLYLFDRDAHIQYIRAG